MQTLGRTIAWNMHMGKRFINSDQFIELCKEVGLHSVSHLELEEYEREGRMYPAARLVMSESYAQAFWNNQLTGAEFQFEDADLPYHELEMIIRYTSSRVDPNETDLRHPVDKAWGKIGGLHQPQREPYQSWDSYNISIEDNSFPSVTHFYHYWQVYELYQVRRYDKKMYQDYTTQYPNSLEYGDILALAPFFDALSYFQHLYRSRYRQIVDSISSDADGGITFDAQRQQNIEQSAHDYASQTLAAYHLNEANLYSAMKGILFLRYIYEQSERYKLAEALKFDVWRMVELIGFAFSVSPEAISDRIGYVGAGTSNQNTLEVMFPNKRKITREKAGKILASIATDYNKATPNYKFSSQDINELLNFVEGTDLAVFEYALVELNETYFNKTSWYAAESFLRLKSLASFPESLIRTLILESRDTLAQQQLAQEKTPTLYPLLKIMICQTHPSIWNMYESFNAIRGANSTTQFQSNLNNLMPQLVKPNSEEKFLGTTLALANLLRNFTSHHLVENSDLLSGQYAPSVQAVLNTAFFIWRDAKRRAWV